MVSFDPIWFARLSLIAAIAVTMMACAGAWIATNALKRAAAIVVALIGATMAGAALGAPVNALIAGAVAAFAYAGLGAALAVRLQEGYGGVETPELDAADHADEQAERTP